MNCSCLVCLKPMERGGNMACTGLELFGVCPSCLADARLGRLVRAMPKGSELIRARDFSKWAVELWSKNLDGEHDKYGLGDTPEAALIKAGVKEGEG